MTDDFPEDGQEKGHDPLVFFGGLNKPKPKGQVADAEVDAEEIGKDEVFTTLAKLFVLGPFPWKLKPNSEDLSLSLNM